MTIVFLSAGFVFWWTSQARESIELLFLFLFLKIFFPNLIYGITPPTFFFFFLVTREKKRGKNKEEDHLHPSLHKSCYFTFKKIILFIIPFTIYQISQILLIHNFF